MPYHVVKRHDKFIVEKTDGSKTFGTHDTETEAQKQMAALYANEPKTAARLVHLLGATGTARTETFNGREHLVIPVVALIGDNVIHAVNAETPEFVPASVLTAQGWDGRPLVLGHPTKDGQQISANDPRVLERQGFGFLAATRVSGKRLCTEAWVDTEKLAALNAALLADLRAGKPTEVSVGAFVQTRAKAGTHHGQRYAAEWATLASDHLAFLPDSLGACSVAMGCGTNRAAMRVCGDKLTLEGSKMSALQTLKARILAVFEDPSTTDPLTQGTTPDADGLAIEDGTSDESAQAIACRSMRTLLDATGDQWDEASALLDALSAEMGDAEQTRARLEALRMLCYAMLSSLQGISNATYAITAPDLPEASDPRYGEALRTAIGKEISAKNLKVIQAAHDASHGTHDSTVALGAACDMKTLTAHPPCHCHEGGRSAEEHAMTTTDRTAALAALTALKDANFSADEVKGLGLLPDANLCALKTLAASKPADAIAHAKIAASVALGMAPPPQTQTTKTEEPDAKLRAAQAAGFATVEAHEEAEFLKTHPTLKTLVDNAVKAEADKKAALVATLKTAGALTEDQLKLKTLAQLEELAAFARLPEPDFSGRGLPSTGNTSDVFANPPDPYKAGLEAMRAARRH